MVKRGLHPVGRDVPGSRVMMRGQSSHLKAVQTGTGTVYCNRWKIMPIWWVRERVEAVAKEAPETNNELMIGESATLGPGVLLTDRACQWASVCSAASQEMARPDAILTHDSIPS